MCEHRPCWGTPEEAENIMNAGLGSNLMLDYWVGETDTYMATPAIIGYQGENAPFWPEGRCAFLKDGLCSLHDKGLKPLEGRTADCKHNGLSREEYNLKHGLVREHIVTQWQTEKGKEVLERFRKEFCS